MAAFLPDRLERPRIATPRRRNDERRTALSLVGLLAVLMLPILGGTVAVLTKRPDGWEIVAPLGVFVVGGLLAVIVHVLVVPLDDPRVSTGEAEDLVFRTGGRARASSTSARHGGPRGSRLPKPVTASDRRSRVGGTGSPA